MSEEPKPSDDPIAAIAFWLWRHPVWVAIVVAAISLIAGAIIYEQYEMRRVLGPNPI
jgi:hypothetical protein